MSKTERTNTLFPSRKRSPLAYGQKQAMDKVVKDIEQRMERKLKEADAILDASFSRLRRDLEISQLLAHQNAVDSRIQNALANIRGAKCATYLRGYAASCSEKEA